MTIAELPGRPVEAIASDEAKPKSQSIISGIRKTWTILRAHARILRMAFRLYRNPVVALRTLQRLIDFRRKVLGDQRIRKLALVENRYYWDLYAPGFGSPAFNKYMIAELARIAPVRNEAAFRANQFINVFVSITNRCNLKCEHCFEGPNLNTGDHITNAELKQRISYLRMLGTSQIQFSGGEPMLRLGLVLDMIETGDEIDYWIYTSGYNLTLENAERLKRKGLTGILVSIDHFEEAEHNRFRGKDHAFEWATHGVRNSIQSGLVTALSVCVTRSLATEEKLRRYADMARQLNVSFVQLLEPKSVGNYRGKDVELSIAEKETLERFYLRMNNSPEFATYPIFTYPGYHQRRVGCFGGGNRSIYLDTYGNLQACPFCQLGKSCGGATLPEQLLQVQTRACVSTAHSDVNI